MDNQVEYIPVTRKCFPHMPAGIFLEGAEEGEKVVLRRNDAVYSHTMDNVDYYLHNIGWRKIIFEVPVMGEPK